MVVVIEQKNPIKARALVKVEAEASMILTLILKLDSTPPPLLM
jgi:hypothetical protein